MSNVLKIAMIQSDIIWENIEENLSRYDKMLEKIDPDTDLVILPEMFSTGFSMNVKSLSESAGGRAVEWMKAVAALKNIVITGSIIFAEDERYYNRLIWMDQSGIALTYDKRHLFRMGKENSYYSQGSRKLIVRLKGWKICPLICYDLRFPVWSRNKEESYDMLIYIANWPSSRNYAWNTLLKAIKFFVV
jgi:predicted amidohydrolase